MEQNLIKADILKFQFISHSQRHFKAVSMSSKVRFSHPDSYQRILNTIKKKMLDLEVDDVLVTIPLQVEMFSLSFIGGNLCQKL